MRSHFIGFAAGVLLTAVLTFGYVHVGPFYRYFYVGTTMYEYSKGVNVAQFNTALANGCEPVQLSVPISAQTLRCPFWITP